ncbi:transcription termination/antitermination protein NusG [Rhizobium tubonense]|uniref:NusG-like N-terminal domain-containing protein n=1 Tax=Rhizobium tubonense TaxID=484088 RepID=A0A2W4DTX7_9HYPH|nr:transcription termination/antitermination NusG family protein [Rhizobium tubonense]PZM07596.1 hypothetical protein CPY51_31195 [Rhizobium tubonense]
MKLFIRHDVAWYVIRTHVQSEYKARNNLEAAGFETYLPTMRVEIKNRRNHTYRQHERILMARYIFVGATMEIQQARRCEGVETILGNDGPIAIEADVVETIFLSEIDMQFDETRAARVHRKEEAKTRKATTALSFPKGLQILINDGVFMGFSGLVDHVTTQGNVEALVEIFGRMTPVSLQPEQLSPIKQMAS